MPSRAVPLPAFLVAAAALGLLVGACGDNDPAPTDASACTPVDDGNACTDDLCENDQPVHPPRAAGTTCPAGVCDGDGHCVECVGDGDCAAPEVCDEASNACVAPTCIDGEQNGDETDVDCGGACAPGARCDDGEHCAVAADCASGVCTGTVCQAPACGDGVRQGAEACDDGNHTNGDGCDDGTGGSCRPSGCGNGTVAGTEECDDTNNVNGDGCDNNCTTSRCGNGVIAGTEVCDDLDATGGDGCSATCTVEPGYTCTGVPSVCVGSCGDGVVTGTEACDDPAPAENGDGCSITCAVEPGYTCTGSPSTCTTTCGDGVRAGSEGCDDPAPAESGDGCNASCFVEPGWVCSGTPSFCVTICGDGIRTGLEACDDPAPAENGDGCSATCTVEPGYTCAGSPSLCGPLCGDGIRLPGEACDDAPPAEGGDGCSATCTIESGWTCTGSPSTCTSTCGDGIPVGTEACDDAPPADDGDGCSAACAIEPGYVCSGAPSLCATVCGDGIVAGGEACDDAPPTEDGDGCTALCTVEPGYNCVGSPSICTRSCGDGVVDPGEQCDDGGLFDNDGCSAACTTEVGYTCTGAPSSCTTTCGDGVTGGAEQCDDAPPAEDGDGCSVMCTREAGYTCSGAPSVCVTTCGDGVTAGAETCDDGCLAGAPGVCEPADDNDGCSAACVNECGNGVLNALVEQCDDGNRVAGDGCSASCTFEVTCGLGETLVQIRSTDVPKTILDNVPAGADSNAVVPAGNTGAIRKVHVGIGRVSHLYTGDVVLSLLSPGGRRRNLVVQRGSSGDNFITTRFDDAAAAPISAGAPPFTGAFQPEQALSTAAGYRDQNAVGTWQLRAADVSGGVAGSLDGWTLSVCIDPSAPYCGDGVANGGEECDDGNSNDTDACSNSCGIVDGCGDGNLDAGEVCDDDNLASGDGCSATCQVDLTCAPGSTAVVVTNATAFPIPDNNLAGVLSPVTMPTAGAVTNAAVYIGNLTHTFSGDVDLYLVGAAGVQRELSTGNGGSVDNYQRTYLDDAAATAVTAGTAPFSGRFRPEQTLATTPGVDFRGANGAGTWSLKAVDHATGDTGTLTTWTLALCVDPGLPYCGDGVAGGAEECDDGNSNDADACNTACGLTDGCGDGNLDAGEQCDDNNLAASDGCSATCQLELSCGAGEVPVLVTSTPALAITDNNTFNNVPVTVATTGAVVRAQVFLASIAHANTGQLDITLQGPNGVIRNLTDDNGSGANYAQTLLTDSAATAITAGASPFTGAFRPEQSLSTTPGSDFAGLGAAGTWNLQVRDDTAGIAGTVNQWTLALCVNPTAGYCGDGVAGGAEECDDGNTNNTDACGNLCQLVDGCGDGNLDAGEQCDDNNVTAGDGCSASCVADIACGAGEVPVIVTNASALPIPDNVRAGVLSPISIPTAGVVRKALVTLSVTHPFDGDVDIFLMSPYGVQRDLSTDQSGVNYTATIFSDAAPTAITAGAAPYTGLFRPEQTVSNAAGFANQAAQGSWQLRIADDASGDVGTLNGWTLALCVDPGVATVCGNGVVEPGETCDDANVVATDGCSATCQLELTCAVGAPVIVQATDLPKIVPDNLAAGATSIVNVATVGTVRKAVVVLGALTHQNDDQLDIALLSPTATVVDLSSDNGGSGDDYVSTILDDDAATAITSGTSPFRGRFRPEVALTAVNGQAAAGAWTLRVADDATSEGGVLNGWTLGLCVE